jgi:hypothetical protein
MTLWISPVLYDRRGGRPRALPGGNRHLLSGVFILSLLWVLLPCRLGAQTDNLERLRQSARLLSDSLLATRGISTDTICLNVVRHPASWLLDEGMIASATSRGIPVATCDSGVGDGLTMAITAIGVSYGEIDDDELLARETRLEVTALVPPQWGGANGRVATHYAIVQRDTVRGDQTSLLEATGYDFVRGTLPSRQGSGFWKKVVEPAVVIGASVVLVILLFTVRSQ